MANRIFLTLLQRQIGMFVATFQEDSTSLFKNEHNNLIHPGEYGMYRERCFCALLDSVLTRDCALSDGFIFSAQDSRSTQCDILVKNAMSMPLMDSGIAKFHPVEDVYAVVEMKSNLTNDELTTALRKLAYVKMIGDDRSTLRNIQESNPLAYDAIPTFLVCNKLEISDLKNLDFDAIYQGIDRKYWHNAILSIEDGLFCYCYSISDLPSRVAGTYCHISVPEGMEIGEARPQLVFQLQQEPVIHNCTPCYTAAKPADPYAHIMRFLTLITQIINLSVKYQFDSTKYINPSPSDTTTVQ